MTPAYVEGRCPAPGCERTPPARCIFCSTHHFQLPCHETRLLTRQRIKCERALDPTVRATLEDQFRAYLRTIVAHLPAEPAGAPEFEPRRAGAWEDIGYRRPA